MKTITRNHLEFHEACEQQLDLFIEEFGDSVELTKENWNRAIAVGLEVVWLFKFLPIGKRAVFTEYRTEQSEKYQEVHKPLWEAYKEIEKPAYDKYNSINMRAYDEYNENNISVTEYLDIKEPAYAKYREIKQPAHIHYMQQRQPILDKYLTSVSDKLFELLTQED